MERGEGGDFMSRGLTSNGVYENSNLYACLYTIAIPILKMLKQRMTSVSLFRKRHYQQKRSVRDAYGTDVLAFVFLCFMLATSNEVRSKTTTRTYKHDDDLKEEIGSAK